MSQQTNPPGYAKLTKKVDSGNSLAVEGGAKGFALKFVGDPKDRIAQVNPVFLIDPGQSGSSPIGPLTILQNGVNVGSAKGSVPNLYILAVGGVSLVDDGTNSLTWNNQPIVRINLAGTRGISAAHAAQTLQIPLDNLCHILSVSMVTSGGTATLVVQGSVDNSTFITLDSIAAAGTIQVTYHPGGKMTSAALTFTSTGLNPLAFRFIKITAGDAGVGNTTQLDVAAK